jgi:hypothetical protein
MLAIGQCNYPPALSQPLQLAFVKLALELFDAGVQRVLATAGSTPLWFVG